MLSINGSVVKVSKHLVLLRLLVDFIPSALVAIHLLNWHYPGGSGAAGIVIENLDKVDRLKWGVYPGYILFSIVVGF